MFERAVGQGPPNPTTPRGRKAQRCRGKDSGPNEEGLE